MQHKEEKRVYLRSLRTRSGINQGDLKDLLGFKNHASISKLEDNSRSLCLSDVIGYHLIFGVPVQYLLYRYIKKQRPVIRARADTIYKKLRSRDAPEDSQRRAFLKELGKRLSNSPNHTKYEK